MHTRIERITVGNVQVSSCEKPSLVALLPILPHRRVLRHFESIAESKPTEITLHGSNFACRMWRYWMTQESDDFNLTLGNGKRLNPFVELAKKLAGMSEFTLGALFSIIDETLPKEKADQIKEITRKCDEELTVNGVQTILHFNGPISADTFFHRTFSAMMAS